ncbi:MAG TPA: protein translocase subunit SecDF [Bacteroidia bacterium]|jgi:SecD/SecF fusion protein|nr:protein translocase subunit SecDF [Bacteroidia bacterium]
MQNKGAIKIFAILLGLACIFYLSFTWVTRSVEADALAYAEGIVTSPKNVAAAKEFAKGNTTKELSYIDDLKTKLTDRYLDSVKMLPVYSLGFTAYTYEECKKREINLGLDLRGGMNVTLEVSVIDIIKSLSNNSADLAFNQALEETQKNFGIENNDDFITLFSKKYKKIAPNGKLAPIFQTIENKGKLAYNATNDEVIKYITLKVDESISNAEKTFRSRIDRFGVAQPNIQKLGTGGRILVELPGVKDKERVRELLQGTANLEFWETYENQEVAQYFEAANGKLRAMLSPETLAKDSTKTDSTKVVGAPTPVNDITKVGKPDSLKKDSENKVADSLKKMAANTPSVNPQDTAVKNFLKRYPLFSQLAPIKPSLYSDGKQQFFTPGPVVGLAYSKEDTAKANEYLRNEKVRSAFPSKMKFMWSSKTKENKNQAGEVVGVFFELYAIKTTDRNGKAALFGDIITDARKDYDQKSGAHPYISMSMNSEAALKWKNLTKANMPQGNKQGRCIAVVMDNMVYSSPRVQSEIAGGQSQITGDFTNEEADALVAILSAGKLPAPARIVEESVVGPTLGQEAIDSGLVSFAIALLVILVFMALYYNKSGLVANIALVANMFFIMGVLTSLGAVLTLPGIAGIVLTIGLAVDANILIFERVREELALGKSTAQSIKEGFKHAMSSIIDSNVTLAILAVILMVFGTGPVQGFATTLLIGIGASLFSAILITRVIFDWMLDRKMEIPFDNNFTRNAFKNVHIDFVAKRKIYYALSSLVIITGVVFYMKNGGFKLGVDFKGGRTYQVRFEKDMKVDDVGKCLAKAFNGAPQVKTLGSANQVKITTTFRVSDNAATADKEVEDALNTSLKTLNTKYEIVQQQKVGPTIATDILYGAYGAILFSCLVMFLYIVVRFKKWQYGLGSVVALFHDVLIVLSFYTIFDGILPFDLEIGQDFIAAILTVMGYTMTETVVVFDRIRERLADSGGKGDQPGEERNKLINFALNSTLSRTILTSLTVFFVLLVIFIWGGESIRGFIFALLIGRVIGTYSSLCISTPIVVDFDKKGKV